MIDDFLQLIPPPLMNQSGLVFYSGRAAFQPPAQIYLMGINPGGDRGLGAEIIGDHSLSVVNAKPERWSSYRDKWSCKGPGAEPMQRRIYHMFRQLGIDLELTPSSNLIFVRSNNADALRSEFRRLADSCWPFHHAVVDRLRPRVILCMGEMCGGYVRRRWNARCFVDEFIEANERRWKSTAHCNSKDQFVVTVTHPARADWTNPQADPTPLVRRILDQSPLNFDSR